MSFGQQVSVNVDGQQGMISPNGYVDFSSTSQNLANVTFYKKAVLNPTKSRELGRAFHESVEYVRIQHPGERDYADKPIADVPGAAQRWPRQWAQYQASQQQVPDGTLVEMLFPSEPEVAANLHGLGVHTIEQLASITEHGLDQIGMGAREWKNRAIKFLDSAGNGAEYHQMKRTIEDLQNKMEVRDNQIALLQSQLDRLLAEKSGVPTPMIPSPASVPMAQGYAASIDNTPKRRGRPPKNAIEG